jgi:hypothetical protein
MKITSIVILIILSVSCAVNRDVLKISDARSKITIDSVDYYILEPKNLPKARSFHTLSYLGSIENFHLMRVWSKVSYSEDEIHFFAIEKEKCVVINENTIEDEFATHGGSYRKVEIVDNKCIVK